MQGDVGALPFEEDTFDYVLCMNGLHVFFRGLPLINNAFTIFRISVNQIMLWFVLSSFDNRKAIIRCRV